MAGTARYTAVLDANVLYPALLRDVILTLADADLYSAKWSVHIRDEWRSAKRQVNDKIPGSDENER